MARRYVMDFERPLVELEDKLADLQRMDLSDKPELAAEIDQLLVEVEHCASPPTSISGPGTACRSRGIRTGPRPSTTSTRSSPTSSSCTATAPTATTRPCSPGSRRSSGRRVAVLGHRKGTDTKENVRRNFGSPHPEGFRKAMRVMRLAEKFGLPLVTFLDTAGAFPGIEAEERGQAWAIAESLSLLSGLAVPVVVVGIGEGGSGGALAIGFGDRLIMLENAYYSVISPEIVRLDPLPRRRRGQAGGDVPEDDRRGPRGARHRRRDRARAARRRAARPRGGLRSGRRRDRRRAREPRRLRSATDSWSDATSGCARSAYSPRAA